jgi:hypothetical protein
VYVLQGRPAEYIAIDNLRRYCTVPKMNGFGR